jgi:hypothetical protein
LISTARSQLVTKSTFGLSLAHCFALLQRAVKALNIHFSGDRRIEIAVVSSFPLEAGAVEPFSSEGWVPTDDVFPIDAQARSSLHAPVPELVSWMTNDGRRFGSLAAELKENRRVAFC